MIDIIDHLKIIKANLNKKLQEGKNDPEFIKSQLVRVKILIHHFTVYDELNG